MPVKADPWLFTDSSSKADPAHDKLMQEYVEAYKESVAIEKARRDEEIAARKTQEEQEAKRLKLEEERLRAEEEARKLEDADRNAAHKTAGKEVDAEEKEAKGENKLASAWGKMKSGAGAVQSAHGAVTKSSALTLIIGLSLAFLMYGMKLRAETAVWIFMADFFMLIYCWGAYGRETIYVFMISFFTPLIALGIVSGAGVPVWVIIIVTLVFISFTPQARAFFSQNKAVFLMEITFFGLVVTAQLINVFHIGGVVLSGLAIDEKGLFGSFLSSFTNQFLNVTWIVYIGIIKNQGDKLITALIKMILLLVVFSLIFSGPAKAAGIGLPGINQPLVTEEGKQQFTDMLTQGSQMFNGIPVIDKVYAATAWMFSAIANVPADAQQMADNIAPSRPADEVTVTGLQLAPSAYAQKVFAPNEEIFADFQLIESQKIQDQIRIVSTDHKAGTAIAWTPCSTTAFYLYFPEGTEFRCSLEESSCGVCATGSVLTAGLCCTTANPPVCIDAPPQTDCLRIGNHPIKARAVYEMTTSSSYTPIFVDRIKKIAAEKSGQNVLSQCGLQAYASPIAEYTPSNSPAALGIVLSQRTMPVVVGEGLGAVDESALAPLYLIVSLKKIHNGFVSQLDSLTVNLPDGLTMETASDCDFEGDGGTYTVTETARARVLWNAEKGNIISYRCQLQEDNLLGDALCTPVTITADARYRFTLETSTSIEIVRPQTY